MSNIDQAFINAYSDQHGPATIASTRADSTRTPLASLSPLRVFRQNTASDAESRVDRAESPGLLPRSPHFTPSAPATSPPEDPYAAIAQRQAAFVDSQELTLPSLIGERKPLSSFATPRQAPNTTFRPVFEVDEFRWPRISDELLSSSQKLLQPIIDTLLIAAGEGRSLVAIAGTEHSVGTSTVTMCLARVIAASGHSVAVVDANFVAGDLAADLGLEFDSGWEDVLNGQIPLAECAVHSIADKITLIPLGGSSISESERLSSIQSSVIAGMLRYHHDLVLFDLGAADNAEQFTTAESIVEHCRVDVGIIVAPSGGKGLATLHGLDILSKMFGPLCLGVIGNRAQ